VSAVVVVVAIVLPADFVYVLGRARAEWRHGDDLSTATGWLITSLYVLTLALLAIAVVWRPWPLDVPPAVAAIVGGVLVLGGTALALSAFVPFASVRQLYGVERAELITAGIYRYSRNPQYTGLGVVLLGAAVVARSGLALLVVAAYAVAVRVWLIVEEEHLSAAFGAEYDEDRRRTARFLGSAWSGKAST
jgi:protein-S-isoprenylcysteine O-methyltransferase Ste14